MLIQHRNNTKEGVFFVEDAGEVLAEMTYRWKGDQLFIIDHTEVTDKLEGKGVGKQLVHAAVEFARANNHKIFPVCSFARSVFDKVKEYQDVLHHSSNG